MRLLTIVLLLLAGCCHHERPRLEGSSSGSVLIFDPDTGRMYWMALDNGRVIREYEVRR